MVVKEVLIISVSNRKEINAKYSKTTPNISVRLPQEIKNKIPGKKSTWIRKAIMNELNPESRITTLKNYMVFLFNFFQKNAPNLEITDLEREEIIKILEVLKSE